MKVSDTTHRLKELMDSLNLSQAELSRRTGLDKSTISYYVNGKREPMQDNIMAISLAFDIDPAWLMGYDVPMRKEKIDVDFIYKTENAEMLVEIMHDKDLSDIVKRYMSLSDERKKAIKNLIESMSD